MRKTVFLVLVACSLALAAPKKPKLILTVVVDQFRFDYLTRYRGEFTGGFQRLLSQGAVFTNANYVHVPTITAVGHSTILSGATPSVSGIVANDWYDREAGAAVTSVSDAATKLLGGLAGTNGSSPRRMLVSTVGDEMKMAGWKSRTIGVSLKDRSAILPLGRTGDAAYWFDVKTGAYVSSTYYFTDVPGWVKEFNAGHPADKYKGASWMGHKMPPGVEAYTSLESTPFGNELTQAFALRALAAEQLGRHEGTDLFVVSYSSNDYVGHEYGPDSPEAHDITLRTDRMLGALLDAAEKQAGAGNVLVVLTADHGVSPLPEANQARRMPGGRFLTATIKATVQNALVKRYGAGEWVWGNWDLAVYLNRKLMAEKNLNPAEVEREAARALAAMPHVFRVYTRDDLIHGRVLPDESTKMVVNGFNVNRSPDVEFLPEPYWSVRTTDKGTSHATPFSYDTHVPVVFLGAGIKPGRYYQQVIVNDIAPTLAAILELEPPAGSIGRVLTEMFE